MIINHKSVLLFEARKREKEIRKFNINNIEFLPNRSCYQNDDIES